MGLLSQGGHLQGRSTESVADVFSRDSDPRRILATSQHVDGAVCVHLEDGVDGWSCAVLVVKVSAVLEFDEVWRTLGSASPNASHGNRPRISRSLHVTQTFTRAQLQLTNFQMLHPASTPFTQYLVTHSP